MAPLRRHRRARRDRAKKRSPRTPGVDSKDLKRVHRPCEGDRAADGYARARGGELVPPGLGGCGMRCTGAWAARGTRKGVHERSAVPRLGHRLVAKGSRTGDYRPDGDLIGKDRLIKRLPGVAVRAEILPNA
eukprot:scaffold32731_cov65-Phaeocystis_antarctica.AAC.3